MKSRQAAYDEKMRQRGYVRTGVWVPSRDWDKLRQYAEKLRQEWEKEQRK